MSLQRCFCLALLLLVGSQLGFSQSTICSSSEIELAAKQVEIARASLLALPVGDGLKTDVSVEGRQAIASMKTRLADFVDSYMRCSGSDVESELIEKDLSRLTNASVDRQSYYADDAPEESAHYGYELEFHVGDTASVPRLLSITARFQIQCGSDTVLFIFDHEQGLWREVLLWQSDPYDSIRDAFWSFDYGVSPPDDSGNWYVVTKYINPWCSSTWSSIHYSTMRPVRGSVKPKVLFTGSDSIWWGSDDFGKLAVNRNDFDLRFHAQSIDGGVHNRVWVRHFSVMGDAVHRIPPFAVSPRDFVDEWIVSSWDEATQWSLGHNVGLMEQMHRRLHAKGFMSFEYQSVRQCSDAPDHYQIELSDQPSYYFQVMGTTDYKMKSVSLKPDPACNGEDLLDKMATQ